MSVQGSGGGAPPHRLEADLLLVLTTLIAAAGWIFSKEALAGMPPLIFIGLRFAIAGLVLAMFSLPQLRALDRRGLRNSLLVGTLFAGGMVLWILGLSHSSHLGEASFISSMGIVMVPVFARLFFGDRPPATTWFALPL
ncbi:MAG: DMT family transporter, partial [Thauera sp.]|nr:DMT family transporter [Thauera sp.]